MSEFCRICNKGTDKFISKTCTHTDCVHNHNIFALKCQECGGNLKQSDVYVDKSNNIHEVRTCIVCGKEWIDI